MSCCSLTIWTEENSKTFTMSWLPHFSSFSCSFWGHHWNVLYKETYGRYYDCLFSSCCSSSCFFVLSAFLLPLYNASLAFEVLLRVNLVGSRNRLCCSLSKDPFEDYFPDGVVIHEYFEVVVRKVWRNLS